MHLIKLNYKLKIVIKYTDMFSRVIFIQREFYNL